MNNNFEVFSIIMPVYNASDTLKESISSVLSQTFFNFKLYIINDCSQDNSKEIILSFKDHRIIYIENEKNLGVAMSRNKGIEKSKGKYIAFIDSDDIWVSHKLEKQLYYLDLGFNIVCSNYEKFKDKNGEIISSRQFKETFNYSDMLKMNRIGNLTGVYNRSCLGEAYQKNIGHEDYLMWLEIMKKENKAYCIQEYLAKYRVKGNSLSSSKKRAARWQWHIYRKHLRFNLYKSFYYFAHYTINAMWARLH